MMYIKKMIKLNADTKRNILLYLINVVALLPLFCFAFDHFSVDSYTFIKDLDMHCLWWIGCFRYFGSAVCKLWFLLGNNPAVNPALDTLFFILFVALATVFLSKYIYGFIKKKSLLSYMIINLSVLITVANVWFINILTYPECIFATSVGVLLCFAAIVFYSSKPSIIGGVVASVFLICSTAVFQQFLIVFTIYEILLINLKFLGEEKTAGKTIITTYVKFIVFVIICGIIYLAIGIGLQKLFEIAPNERAAFSIQVTLDNFKYYVSHQHSYLKGRGFFDTEILTACYAVTVVVWIVSFVAYIRKNKFSFKCFTLLLSFIAAYGSSFAAGLITTSRSARAMFGLFSIFALFSISSMIMLNRKKLKYILGVTLLLVYTLNIFKVVGMSIEKYELNEKERIYANLYLAKINQYESETNTTVKRIIFCTDSNVDATKEESSLLSDTTIAGLMYSVSGRDFEVSNTADNKYRQAFESRDWKSFNPDEQLIFEGDSLYLCLY